MFDCEQVETRNRQYLSRRILGRSQAVIERAYIRYREDLPESQATYAAAEGFSMQGIPTTPFHGFGDLDALHAEGKLTPDTIVCGYIVDVHSALELLGVSLPPPIDYPKHLEWMFGREIRKTTLGDVRNAAKVQFVKPIRQKRFTGRVYDPDDPIGRVTIATVSDDEECFSSDVINFLSEWRCFVRDGELVGVKHYKGDWSLGFDKDVLVKAVKQGRRLMPAGHSLDIGVTDDGRTCLVEANDGFSLGDYGLPSIIYARLVESRWKELMRNK